MGHQSLIQVGLDLSTRGVIRSCVAAAALFLSARWIYPYLDAFASLPRVSFSGEFSLTNPTILIHSGFADEIGTRTALPMLAILALALPMLVSPKYRLAAFAGAMLGYVAGWWASLAFAGFADSIPWGAWALRALLVGVLAILIVTVVEPVITVIDRWATSPKVIPAFGVLLVLGGGATGYAHLAAYVGERLDYRQDRAQMRRTYRALILYEQDNDSASAPSLADVAPTYLEPSELASPADKRPVPKKGLYPANLYVYRGPDASRMVPFRVSYAYAKPFESQFSDHLSWDTLQRSPNAAVLANAQYRYSRWEPRERSWERPHGFAANRGPIMRVMSDGSLKIVSVPRCGGAKVGGDYEVLFFADETGFADWTSLSGTQAKTLVAQITR